MEDLLELSSDAMKYIVIEERLMDPLRKKWKDAKRTSILNVGFYIRQEGLLIIFNLISLLI